MKSFRISPNTRSEHILLTLTQAEQHMKLEPVMFEMFAKSTYQTGVLGGGCNVKHCCNLRIGSSVIGA